eukprot:jgi/Hompol1/2860/HPOL_003038-RA
MVIGGKAKKGKPTGKRGGGGAGNRRMAAASDEPSEDGFWVEPPRDLPPSGSDSDSDSGDDRPGPSAPRKPLVAEEPAESEPAIEVDNPNRIANKPMKASDMSASQEQQQLSRREREALEKERAKEAYWKAQMEGKTDQARADLARLALIRKQREEAAARRAEEAASKQTVKSESLNAGKALLTKTLGKST